MPAIVNRLGEGLAVDELHGVVVHAALAAHRVNRDNVRVVELGGGEGLGLESAELGRVHRGRERKDLEGHTAMERDLLGLVNHAHTAPADFADDPEVAQISQDLAGIRVHRQARDLSYGRVPDLGHHLERREDSTKTLGLVGVVPGQIVDVHRLAALEPVGALLDQVFQGVVALDVRLSPMRRCGWPGWSSLLLGVVGVLGGPELTQPLQGTEMALLDGGLADGQGRGDLGGRHLLEVAKDQHLAVARLNRASAACTRSLSSERIACRLGLVPLARIRCASKAAEWSGNAPSHDCSRPASRRCVPR